jgi:hypothetical protein
MSLATPEQRLVAPYANILIFTAMYGHASAQSQDYFGWYLVTPVFTCMFNSHLAGWGAVWLEGHEWFSVSCRITAPPRSLACLSHPAASGGHEISLGQGSSQIGSRDTLVPKCPHFKAPRTAVSGRHKITCTIIQWNGTENNEIRTYPWDEPKLSLISRRSHFRVQLIHRKQHSLELDDASFNFTFWQGSYTQVSLYL